jgi:hypothetical protein
MARLDSGLVLLLDAAGALTAEDAALLSSLEVRAGAGGPAQAPSAGAGASDTTEDGQG